MTRKETMKHLFNSIPIGNLIKECTQYVILIGTTTDLSTADVPNIYVDVRENYQSIGLSFNSMSSMDNFRRICQHETANLEKVLKNIPNGYNVEINKKCGNGPGQKYIPIIPPMEPSTVTGQFLINHIKRDDNTVVNGKKYKWVYPCVNIATRMVNTPVDVINEIPVLIALLHQAIALQNLCFTRVKHSEVLRQFKKDPNNKNLKRMEQSYSEQIQKLEKVITAVPPVNDA